MPSQRTRRQKEPSPTSSAAEMTIVRARDVLGEVVDEALYAGKRTIITRRGRPSAAVVSMADYNRLKSA
jgi:prevent-host-death family protein